MTYGPLRGETLSVSPCEGEDLVPEVGRNPSPCVSPLHRGEQEGSSGARILRFSHRLNASLGLRQNIVLRPVSSHNPWSPPTILQERTNTGKPKQTRTDDPRARRGRSRCRSEALIAGGGADRRRMHGSKRWAIRAAAGPRTGRVLFPVRLEVDIGIPRCAEGAAQRDVNLLHATGACRLNPGAGNVELSGDRVVV